MTTLNVFAVACAKAARLLIAAALGAACTVTYADTYQYDERGDLETLTTPRGVRTYQYDEVQRLKLEQGYTGNREHVYDRNGNRATDGATAPGSPTAATYADDSNRIATINGATVSIDAAGQITNDGVNTYTWDDAGRLKTVSRAGQLRATYHYDHKHRRTRKVTTAAAPQGVQTIRYHYDDRDRLMAETTGAGVPLRSYVRADDTLLAIAEHIPQGGGTYEIRMLYLELDHLGTPRQARIDGGAIVWRWESDGYGTSPANEDPDGNGQPTTVNLRFPGQYYDEESGLHYNWHRYYVPRLGRYLSSDPIGIEGGENTYGYVDGNPLSMIDPFGLAGCFVNFPDFPITVPGTNWQTTITSGHAGALGYASETGATRYYEYGRYDSDFGNVRRRSVPDLKIGKDGQPTPESKKALEDALSRIAGKETRAELTCDKDIDEKKMYDYAEKVKRDAKRAPYSWKPWASNTCRDFARRTLDAGRQ